LSKGSYVPRRRDPDRTRHDEPDVELVDEADGTFRLWFDGLAYPDATGFDLQWLDTTVHCRTSKVEVWLRWDYLTRNGLSRWLNELIAFDEALTDVAGLDDIEPEIKVRIRRRRHTNSLRLTVDIELQAGMCDLAFRFRVRADDLSKLSQQLEAVTRHYPPLAP
jgi:hypothetical protein